MGDIADDIIEGHACGLCGCYFKAEHGYPVLCEDCWDDASKSERRDWQKAHIEEL